MAVNLRLRIAYATAAQWTAWNGILKAGQIGWESDTGKFKVGDNATTWTALAYSHYTIAEITSLLAGKSDTGHNHDDRYFTEAEVTAALAGKSNTGHTHVKAEITDFAHTHPISDVVNLQTTLDAKADLVGGVVPSGQLPSYVDDVVEAANFAALPGTGEAGKIYVTLDDGKTYRWSGSAYVEISASLALGETSGTAYRGDRGKTAYDHSQIVSGNPHGTAIGDIAGLQSSLDSKVDENVPITGATKTKVTYDAKGLVTAGADATTADIADSADRRYLTDAQQTVVQNTSGVNTGDQDLSPLAPKASPTFTGTVVLPNVTLGGINTFSEDAELRLDPALSADGKFCGITEVVTAGETIAFGELVYLKAADSQWYLADADADSTSGAVKLAIAVTSGTDNNSMTVLHYGKIRADAKFPALTIGAPAYVSTTPGAVQTAQPSGTDDVIRIVGHALTADELFFNPSNEYITHI